MAVYVDQLRDYGTAWLKSGARTLHSKSCHMVADTLPELHAMADLIGLRREWFQPLSSPHYDLTPRRREAAVKAGAVEVDRSGFVAVIRRLRESPSGDGGG